jgi:hypothetical protein
MADRRSAQGLWFLVSSAVAVGIPAAVYGKMLTDLHRLVPSNANNVRLVALTIRLGVSVVSVTLVLSLLTSQDVCGRFRKCGSKDQDVWLAEDWFKLSSDRPPNPQLQRTPSASPPSLLSRQPLDARNL